MVALTSTTDFTAWTSVDNPRAHACAGWSNLATASEYQAIEQSISSSVAATNELNGKSNHERQEVDRVDQRNQQYSIYALTNSSGVVQERYAYTAYGQPTFLNASAAVQTSSAAGNRYTYTAREWDATLGLHYFRARWMSGLTGRFLSRDPIGFEGSPYNLYEFLSSNSLDGVDPTGLDRGGYKDPDDMAFPGLNWNPPYPAKPERRTRYPSRWTGECQINTTINDECIIECLAEIGQSDQFRVWVGRHPVFINGRAIWVDDYDISMWTPVFWVVMTKWIQVGKPFECDSSCESEHLYANSPQAGDPNEPGTPSEWHP